MNIEVKSAASSAGDYYWTGSMSSVVPQERYLRDLDKAYSVLAEAHGDGTYSVLMHRLRTVPEKRDSHNRAITASVYISGLAEKAARSLLMAYFRDREGTEAALCNPDCIRVTADAFSIDRGKLASAVSKIVEGAGSMGEEPVERGELWSEDKALERKEEFLAWLERHRMGNEPGPRIVCSHFLIPENLPPVDLALFVSGEGKYTRPVSTELEPTYPNNKRVWIGIGIAAAVIMLAWGTWRVVKRLNTPNPVKLEQSVQKPESPTANNPS